MSRSVHAEHLAAPGSMFAGYAEVDDEQLRTGARSITDSRVRVRPRAGMRAGGSENPSTRPTRRGSRRGHRPSGRPASRVARTFSAGVRLASHDLFHARPASARAITSPLLPAPSTRIAKVVERFPAGWWPTRHRGSRHDTRGGRWRSGGGPCRPLPRGVVGIRAAKTRAAGTRSCSAAFTGFAQWRGSSPLADDIERGRSTAEEVRHQRVVVVT